MRLVRTLAIGSLAVATALSGGTAAVGATGVQAGSAPLEVPDGTVVEVPILTELTHPVSLADALAWAGTARGANPVEGVRFESDTVVGEYWMTEDRTPEAFLKAFKEDTGTEPEVVGLLSFESVPYEDVLAGRIATETAEIPAEVFSAPPATLSEDSLEQRRGEEERPPSSERLAPGDTWVPRDAYSYITKSAAFPNSVQIKQTYQWFGLNPFSYPGKMPNHWGAEFGVDFYTDLPQYQAGTRPSCWPGWEESTAATNDAFTWWVMVSNGTEYVMDPGPIGFYGDYFDLLDECYRTSIAVGAADPRAIPDDPTGGGTQWISITILATKGNAATSRIGGNVQALERYTCEQTPSAPLTTCMGLDTNRAWPGPGVRSQLTKNVSPAWLAPDRCWYTPDFGSAAYDMGCGGGPGN